MKRILALVAVSGLLCVATEADAATDNQIFNLTVNSSITITAPVATVGATEANADADTVFATQTWTITCNNDAGGLATFSTSNVFVHSVNTLQKADVKLDLGLGTTVEGDWAIVQSTDTTNYGAADLVATVSASSSAPADAELDLTVTFKNTNSSLLSSGTYSVTVTGTIAGN